MSITSHKNWWGGQAFLASREQSEQHTASPVQGASGPPTAWGDTVSSSLYVVCTRNGPRSRLVPFPNNVDTDLRAEKEQGMI